MALVDLCSMRHSTSKFLNRERYQDFNLMLSADFAAVILIKFSRLIS